MPPTHNAVTEEPTNPRFSLWWRAVGWLASLLCLAYVGRELLAHRDFLAAATQADGWGWALAGGALLWVCVNTCLGLGWQRLVVACGGAIEWQKSVSITWQTQVAKYLPGNVFHLAGRVYLSRREKVPVKTAVVATLLEASLLVAAGIAFGIAYWLPASYAMAGTACVWLGLVGILALSLRVGESLWSKWGFCFGATYPGLFLPGLAYAGVFLIQGVIAVALGLAMAPDSWSFQETLPILSIAWVAGFLTVGSPGGIGVREAAFVALAQTESEKASMLLLVVGIRIVSILGDLLCLALAKFLNLRTLVRLL